MKSVQLLIGVLSLAAVLTEQPGAAMDLQVVGKPQVRQAVMPAYVSFLGGSVELIVQVRVLDDDGKPVPNARVKVAARTEGGGISRLRAYGISDSAGIALVRTAFDVPHQNMKAKIMPCLAAAASGPDGVDECGPEVEADLTQKNDLSLGGGYLQAVAGGDNLGMLNSYSFRGKFSRNLFGGRSTRLQNSLTASVEGGFAVNKFPLVPKVGPTLTPGSAIFSVGGVGWSRLVFDAQWAPEWVRGSGLGFRSVAAAYMHPLNRYVHAGGGYDLSWSQSSEGISALTLTTAPSGVLVYAPRGNSNVFTARLRWERWQETPSLGIGINGRFQPVVQVQRLNSPSAVVSWDWTAGGGLHYSTYVMAQRITTDQPIFGYGVMLTFNNLLKKSASILDKKQ